MNKKRFLFIFGILFFIVSFVHFSSAIDVTECGELNQSDTIYYLINDVSSNTTCFNITANSVTFDLNGYSVNKPINTVPDYYAIFSKNTKNTTIKNIKGNWSANEGFIKLDGVNDSKIINGTLIGEGGIFLQDVKDLEIDNVTLDLINAAAGIEVSWNNNPENIHAVNITNVVIRGSADDGLSLNTGYEFISTFNIIVKDSNISNSDNFDVRVLSGGMILINTSYVTESSSDILIRKWYYRAYVNDTAGRNIDNVEVKAYNVTNDLIESLTTDENGWTKLGELIEYVNDGGTRNYYSNYTIYASKAFYEEASKSHNITLERNIYKDIFTLSLSDLYVPYTGATQNVDLGQQNITTTGSGFFGFLGSLTNRITTLFVEKIEATSGIINGNLDIDGDLNVTGEVIGFTDSFTMTHDASTSVNTYYYMDNQQGSAVDGWTPICNGSIIGYAGHLQVVSTPIDASALNIQLRKNGASNAVLVFDHNTAGNQYLAGTQSEGVLNFVQGDVFSFYLAYGTGNHGTVQDMSANARVKYDTC